MNDHRKICVSVFTNRIFIDQNLEVFCIEPKAPMKERCQADRVALMMHKSHEVPGDMVGWYSYRERKKWPYYTEPSYAFIPVFKGQVAGFVIVRKRRAFAYTHLSLKSYRKPVRVNSDPQEHQCIEKIWICETYRRIAIASRTVRAIARYFDEDVEKMGWMCPFTEGGRSLALSFSGKTVYACS